MKKIYELKYGEYITKFYITKKVLDFLKLNKVKYSEFLPDNYGWYEVVLFDLIEKEDNLHRKFGKKFKVVYYGITTKIDDGKTEIDEDKIRYKEKKFVDKGIKVVPEQDNVHKSFAINYVVLEK